MRTHAQIVEDGGGYKAVAEKLSLPSERARFWAMRDSIPGEFWKKVSDGGLATLEELAAAAEAKKAAGQDAAA